MLRRRRRGSRLADHKPASNAVHSDTERPRFIAARIQIAGTRHPVRSELHINRDQLVRGIADGVADTVCRPGVTPQSLAEVRRFGVAEKWPAASLLIDVDPMTLL